MAARTRFPAADRRFAALFAAHLVSNRGDWLAYLALFGLAVLEWDVGAAHVSALAVEYVVPLAIVAPLAGMLVDRWSLRRVMVASDHLRSGIVLAMAFFADSASFLMLSLGARIAIVGVNAGGLGPVELAPRADRTLGVP